MKKLFSAVLAMTLAVTMLAGCTRQVVVVVSPKPSPLPLWNLLPPPRAL